MIEGIRSLNLIIGVAGLTICVLGFVQAITGRSMQTQTRRYLITFFSLLTAYVLCNLVGQFGHGVLYQTLTLFFESAFSSLLTLLLTSFLLVESGEADWWRTPAFRTAAGIETIYLALLVYTQFSTTIYYFSVEGVYHRGPYYPLLLVPPVCIMLVNLYLLWARRKQLSKGERIAFAVYILVPMACMVFQMLFYGVYVIVLGSSVSAMVMFLYIQDEQTEQFYRQQEENARLRTDIMLSQIQPHFLYNSLSVIRGISLSDPVRAEAAIGQFTEYLRHNMDSITTDKPILFERELDHVRCYAELQKLRFGEELRVEYDLECTLFSIPTLTLQPLVENAITYGARKRESGVGVVSIRSREYPDHYEISVTDNGPGFVPDALPGNSERSHTGLQNVRARLERVCGGELRVESTPGEGTTATIILPKEEG